MHLLLLVLNPLPNGILCPLRATAAGTKCPSSRKTTIPSLSSDYVCSPKFILGFVQREVKFSRFIFFKCFLNNYFRIKINFSSFCKNFQKSSIFKCCIYPLRHKRRGEFTQQYIFQIYTSKNC